jgi:hypothetical protein
VSEGLNNRLFYLQSIQDQGTPSHPEATQSQRKRNGTSKRGTVRRPGTDPPQRGSSSSSIWTSWVMVAAMTMSSSACLTNDRRLCCLLKAKSSVSMPEWRNWCVNTKIEGSQGIDRRAPHTFMSFTSLDSTAVQSGAAVAAILVTVQGGGDCSAQDGGSSGAVWCDRRRMGAHRELLDGSIDAGWRLAKSC